MSAPPPHPSPDPPPSALTPALPLPSPSSTVWQPFDWYASPHYYDVIFEEETEAEADWLSFLYSLYSPPPDPHLPFPLLLEPACGSGRLLVALQHRGYSCIGFDLSPGAVAYARHRLSPPPSPSCTVFLGGLIDFSSTHADVVPPLSIPFAHTLVSSLKYLLSPIDVLSHFRSIHSVLCPLGVYVVVLHLSSYDDPHPSVDEWEGSRDSTHIRATITCSPPHPSTRTEDIDVHMQVTEGNSPPTFLHTHEVMRTYDRGEVWLLLRSIADRFLLLETFDYHHATQSRVDCPLQWPHSLSERRGGEGKGKEEAEAAVEDAEWVGWDDVEAVAVVLQKR